MSKRRLFSVLSCIAIIFFVLSPMALAYTRFAETLCHQAGYTCLTIKRGDSWGQLYPDSARRDLMQRVNRLNVFLEPDMILAVPNDLARANLIDLSPFKQTINTNNEKKIIVNLALLAWAAYDSAGYLLKWGPISPGTKDCLDVPEGCSTPVGEFRAIRKQGADCVSSKFPQRINGINGGGEMPYCVFFHYGFALHGSSDLPGFPASSGCVRLLTADAKWINEEFIDLPSKIRQGTKIIIE